MGVDLLGLRLLKPVLFLLGTFYLVFAALLFFLADNPYIGYVWAVEVEGGRLKVSALLLLFCSLANLYLGTTLGNLSAQNRLHYVGLGGAGAGLGVGAMVVSLLPMALGALALDVLVVFYLCRRSLVRELEGIEEEGRRRQRRRLPGGL